MTGPGDSTATPAPPIAPDSGAVQQPPAVQPPAAESTGTTPPIPGAHKVSIASSIATIVSDQVEKAKEAAVHTPQNVAAGLAEAGSGLSNLAVAAARKVPGVGSLVNKGLSAVTGQTVTSDTPTSEVNPFQLKPDEVEQAYGKPANWMDSAVRGIAGFAALDALTFGAGPEIKAAEGASTVAEVAAASANTGLRTVKVATLMTAGSDPRTKDFLTTQLAKSPGSMSRFFGSLLMARPEDPDWLAYTRAEGRNLLSAATMEVAIGLGSGIWAAARNKPGVLTSLIRSSAPDDAATIERLPDGGAKVTESAEHQERLAAFAERHKALAEQEAQARAENPDLDPDRPAGDTPTSGPGSRETPGVQLDLEMPESEATANKLASLGFPDMSFPSAGEAEVEVASRNEAVRQAELHTEGPETYKEGYNELRQAMSEGAHPALIQQIIRDHDIQVPYGADARQIQDHIAKIGELIGNPEVDGHLSAKASALLDHEASPEEMTARFADWFKSTDNLAAKIRGAHLYLRILGDQAARLGEALEAAPESPTAQANVDKMWDTMMQVYAPLRGVATVVGKSLREFGSPGVESGEEGAAPAAFGAAEGGPEPRETTNTQPTEKLAAGQTAAVLDPEARDEFARSLRIANGDPTELLEATRQAQARAKIPEGGKKPANPAAAMKGSPPLPEKDAVQSATGTLSKSLKADEKAKKMEPGEKAWNSFQTYMINNMIAAPSTAIKIATANMLMAMKMPFETMVGGGIRGLKGAVKGFDISEIKGGGSLAQQGVHQLVGLMTEFTSALSAAGRAFRAGGSRIDPVMPMFPNGKISPEFYDLGAANFLYVPAFAPSRIHTTITEFTKTLTYRSWVRSEALMDAARQNLNPTQTGEAVARHLNAAFDPEGKAINNAQAIYEARRATFTQPLDNTLWGKDVHDLLAKHPVARLILAPFQKIGTNIFRENWSMFPGLGNYQSRVKQALRSGGDAAARAQANQAFGAAMLGTGIYLAAKGHLPGRGPDDPRLRQQRTDNQIEPYTLTVGGYRVSLDRVEPFGKLMELGADMEQGGEGVLNREAQRKQFAAESGDNKYVYLANHPVCQSLRQIADLVDCTRGSLSEDGMHAVTAVAASLAQKAENDEWFASASKIMDILTAPSRPEAGAAAHRWISDELATVIPGSKFWQNVNNDPIHRETRSIIENLRSKVPGFSKTLEPHYNIFGEPTELPPGFVDWMPGNHINPFITGKVTGSDSLQTALLAIGKSMPEPRSTTPGLAGQPDVDWKDRSKWDQTKGAEGVSPWARWHELMATPMFNGQTAREVVQSVMSDPEVKAMPDTNPLDPDGPKYELIAGVMRDLTKAAIQTMMAEPRYSNFARAVMGNNLTRKINKDAGTDIAHSVYQSLMQDRSHILGQPSQSETFTPTFEP